MFLQISQKSPTNLLLYLSRNIHYYHTPQPVGYRGAQILAAI